jgi:hypothetical protein
MQFLEEDIFADVETGKVVASWRSTFTIKGEPVTWLKK